MFTKMSWRWHEAKSRDKGTKKSCHCAYDRQKKEKPRNIRTQATTFFSKICVFKVFHLIFAGG